MWLFIGGDLVFLLMELFFWFYLRALNTNGMWRGVDCSKANPCTDGLGNPITSEIAKANPAYTLTIAGLAVIAAVLVWRAEASARDQAKRARSAAAPPRAWWCCWPPWWCSASSSESCRSPPSTAPTPRASSSSWARPWATCFC